MLSDKTAGGVLPRKHLRSVSKYIHFRKTTAPYRQAEIQKLKTKFFNGKSTRWRRAVRHWKVCKHLYENKENFNSRCTGSMTSMTSYLCEVIFQKSDVSRAWRKLQKRPVFYGSIPVYVTREGINSYKPTKYL